MKLSIIASDVIDVYNKNQPILSRWINNVETAMVIKKNELKQKNKLKLRKG